MFLVHWKFLVLRIEKDFIVKKILTREASRQLVVEAKYGTMWEWCSNKVVSGIFGIGVWKIIIRQWEDFCFIGYKVHKGSKINIWINVLCGDQPLQTPIPEFHLSRYKEALVADHSQISDNMPQQYVSLRATEDWETMFSSFFNKLFFNRRRRCGDDQICWILSKRVIFEVESFFNELFTPPPPSQRKNGSSFPWKCIWRNKAPSQIAFLFGWQQQII